jgi:hypothetical protein
LARLLNSIPIYPEPGEAKEWQAAGLVIFLLLGLAAFLLLAARSLGV